MPHDHHHHVHAHQALESGDRRLVFAILLNVALTFVQIAAGILSGSLAMIADAVHNLSDAASLVIAWGARRIGRRPADLGMTFGYRRAESVAALVNYVTLMAIGFYLVGEAVQRFLDPQPVTGVPVMIVAGIALVIDVGTAILIGRMVEGSANMRAAFLHNLADALGSVAVLAVGFLVWRYGWTIADPIATLGIAGYVLYHGFAEIGPTIRLLMLGTPPGIDAETVRAAMMAQDGVANVHHLHLFEMEEGRPALTASVTLSEGRWSEGDAIKAALKELLVRDFAIDHATLELECARHAPRTVRPIGHGGRERHHAPAIAEPCR